MRNRAGRLRRVPIVVWLLGVTAACVVALVSVLGAGAAVSTKGVVGYFGGTGTSAGKLTTPRGVALNQSPGNVYAVDGANNRIVEFNSNGEFVRAFGNEVIESGPDQASGFDICVPASGDVCKAGVSGATGGALNAPQGIAVNQSTGNLYVTDQSNLRVDEFSENGSFIAAFGQGVVSSGPDLVTAASAVQTLTVTATGGKYTLSFGGQSAGELASNASASAIQTALTTLSSIGSSNATVSETSAGVFKITFAGALANNPEPPIAATSAPSPNELTGGTASVANTTTGASGYDVCVAANGDVCKAGVSASTGGAFKSTFNGYPTIAPVGAVNAGNVLVADPGNLRVQEFTAAGAFVRAFGLNAVSAGPDNNGTTNFEVCTVAGGDACGIGSTGAGNGAFATATPTRVAEDAAGDLYTVEPTTNFRVQKFTLSGSAITPQGPFDAAELTGTSSSGATQNNPTDVTVGPATSDLLVTKVFAAGATASCPITGVASVQERRVLELSSAGIPQATHMACAGINAEVNGLAMRTSASGGNIYVSSTTGESRLYVLNTGQPIAPTASITNITGIGPHGANVSGLVNPEGPELPYGNNTGYRFEYKRSSESTWTALSATEVNAGNRTTSKLVTQQLEGLQAETSYDVRLVATKPYGAGSTTSTVTTFSTAPDAPEVSVPQFVSVSGTTAQLQGSVNPDGTSASYHFEYTTLAAYQANGFIGATSTPNSAGSAGSGTSPVWEAREVTGLTPGTTYEMRLVVTNGTGSATSASVAFTVSSLGNCPNEEIREEQVSEAPPYGSTYLPDCMAIEMISPPTKYQGAVVSGSLGISESGERVLFKAAVALAETPAFLSGVGDPYVATRGVSGWTTAPTSPPAEYGTRAPGGLAKAYGLNSEFTHWFQLTGTESEVELGMDQVFSGGLGRTFAQLSPLLVPNGNSGTNETIGKSPFQGSSEDQSHLYFQAGEGAAYLPGDPEPGKSPKTAGRLNTYVAHLTAGREPTVELLARDRQGTVWGGTCGTRVGGDGEPLLTAGGNGQAGWVRNQGAISADGSRVYFSTHPSQAATASCNTGLNETRILKREETSSGAEITELISSECTRTSPSCDQSNGEDLYQGASDDGTKVYFATNRQLTNADLDSGSESCNIKEGKQGCDLYLYESTLPAGHRLIDVSTGDSTDPTPGYGARVIAGTVAISTDGSHVYFVAQGVLTLHPNPEGKVATAGELNLYAYERDAAHPNGRLSFVGVVSSSDKEKLWGGPGTFQDDEYPVPATGRNASGEEVGGDGHILVFESKASLTVNDTDGGKLDIYRYDMDSSPVPMLECISCRPGGVDSELVEVEGRENKQGGTGLSNSERLEILRWVSEDGDAIVFKTTEGMNPGEANGVNRDYLWRDGQFFALPGTAGLTGHLADVPVISLDGDEVAFRTEEQLVPQDGDSAVDVYVARVDGGYPIPTQVPLCEGERCQEPFSMQPGDQGLASELLGASGNVALVQSPMSKPVAKPKRKSLTRAQKLANALKACRKEPKKQRAACERRARKRYATKTKGKHKTGTSRSKKSSAKGGK